MNKGVLTFKHGRQLVNCWSDSSLPRRRLVGRLPLRLWWSSSRRIKMPKPCHITSETTATDDLSALVFKWVVFFFLPSPRHGNSKTWKTRSGGGRSNDETDDSGFHWWKLVITATAAARTSSRHPQIDHYHHPSSNWRLPDHQPNTNGIGHFATDFFLLAFGHRANYTLESLEIAFQSPVFTTFPPAFGACVITRNVKCRH